jgi:hypothetical protein
VVTISLKNVATSESWNTFNSDEAATNRPELVVTV